MNVAHFVGQRMQKSACDVYYLYISHIYKWSTGHIVYLNTYLLIPKVLTSVKIAMKCYIFVISPILSANISFLSFFALSFFLSFPFFSFSFRFFFVPKNQCKRCNQNVLCNKQGYLTYTSYLQ